MRAIKSKTTKNKCKRFSGNFWKGDKKTEIEDITPVERRAVIKYFVLCVRNWNRIRIHAPHSSQFLSTASIVICEKISIVDSMRFWALQISSDLFCLIELTILYYADWATIRNLIFANMYLHDNTLAQRYEFYILVTKATFCHSNIKFISSSHSVISSMYY